MARTKGVGTTPESSASGDTPLPANTTGESVPDVREDFPQSGTPVDSGTPTDVQDGPDDLQARQLAEAEEVEKEPAPKKERYNADGTVYDGPEEDWEEEEEDDGPAKWVVLKDAQFFETRMITANDWARVGVEGPEVRWDFANDHRVRIDVLTNFLTPRQFEDIIGRDDRLEVVEG